jgi:hypothetical protein
MAYSTIAFAALAAAQAAAPQSPLNLTCGGAGTAIKDGAMTGYTNTHVSGMVGTTPVNGSGYGTTTVYGIQQQAFEDQVDVRLFGGDDSIRMPRTMLPFIHGGNGGWFKLKNIVADARSIHASAALGPFSNPKVYIDRVTGTISISGSVGDYSGQCRVIDASTAPKF